MSMHRRNAVVIGGAQGIGFAIAQLLAKDCDTLSIIDIDKEAAERAADRISATPKAKLLFLGVDITKREAVAAAREQIVAALGVPSILINSAALTDDKLFLDSTPDDWERVLRVGLYGSMNVLHEFLPGMVGNGYGRVVCLASDSYKLGQARLSYYAAAKGGVVALVKSLAQELGRSGVTLNVVSPGATNTDARQARETKMRQEMGPEKYERRQKAVLKLYPTGRLGEPHDIAAAVRFLTSDDASWITGQVLSVNGGFTMA